ncbi:hypothetical protein BC827DRAFT_1294816 [Russula dissimulans]|nr:hypothetical protein BC827DRAFT_1294816 [Russula dissimulans]
MDNTAGSQVKFFPPLHEQRRSWALEILRRERVTTVLDAGCGEGVFLQHLTHAPPWRAHTPETPAPAVFEKPDFIHVRELHGLDITRSDLLHAIDVTAPPKHGYGWTRFEQLDISVWEGGLEVPNAAFKDIECIVATEVIEHLPEHVVDSFAPVLLGNYAPRLLLLTTPCFDFNERFHAPGEDIWGFPDPTSRTTRTFRHPDHRFEWTVDECVEWCKAAAEEWGYEVTISGLGCSITKDLWGRDGDTVRASQAVTFRRREGSQWATARAAKYAKWASKTADDARHHLLLTTHHYEAHVDAEKPGTREDIAAAAKKTIQDIGSPDVTIFELWREDAVSTICGGWLELLIDVLDQDDSFAILKEGNAADDWKVQLPGVELHGRNPWQSTSKPEDPWGEGESSETTDDTETCEDDDEYEYGEYAQEEYDGDSWDETEDGWATSDAEERSKEDTGVNALKTWEEWKPTPGWIVEANSWD